MTPPAPAKPDRSGFRAALILWLVAVGAVMWQGLEVTDERPKMWLGHWICNIWAFIGWIPILMFARSEPQPPEDRQR